MKFSQIWWFDYNELLYCYIKMGTSTRQTKRRRWTPTAQPRPASKVGFEQSGRKLLNAGRYPGTLEDYITVNISAREATENANKTEHIELSLALRSLMESAILSQIIFFRTQKV